MGTLGKRRHHKTRRLFLLIPLIALFLSCGTSKDVQPGDTSAQQVEEDKALSTIEVIAISVAIVFFVSRAVVKN